MAKFDKDCHKWHCRLSGGDPMATMNISLPDALKEWAEARVAEGRYSSVSDYVRDLIRREQDRIAAIAEIQSALDAGEASGYGAYSRTDMENALGIAKDRDAA
jgi:antitoxin ParD1/3/4